jgi:hypothetical protein
MVMGEKRGGRGLIAPSTNAVLQTTGHHQLGLPFPPGQMRCGLLQEITYYYARILPETATANRILGCRAVSLPFSQSVQNHATLHPATLSTLYRLSQHIHLVLCHPTPLGEVWTLAYKVFQTTQIAVPDRSTREPASAGRQIGQQRPRHEGVRAERQGSYGLNTHRTIPSSKSASPSDSPSWP